MAEHPCLPRAVRYVRLAMPIAVAALIGTGHLYAREPAAVKLEPRQEWSNVFGGEEIELTYRVQTDRPLKGSLAWRHSAGGRTLARGERALVADGAKPSDIEIRLAVPEVRETIVYNTEFRVQLLDAQRLVLAEHQRTLRVFAPDPFVGRRQWLENLAIVLYDPEETTASALESLEIPFRSVRSLSALEAVNEGVVVIGAGTSLRASSALPEILLRLASSGRPVLCLAPADGRFAFPGTTTDASAPTALRFRRRDVIGELDKRLDVHAWRSEQPPAQRGLEVVGYRGQVFLAVTEEPQAWPWLEVAYTGGGRVILCGFRIAACWETSPTPRYLLLKILERMANQRNWHTDPFRGE